VDLAVGQTNKRRLTALRNRLSCTACGNLRLLLPGSKTKGRKERKPPLEKVMWATVLLLDGHERITCVDQCDDKWQTTDRELM